MDRSIFKKIIGILASVFIMSVAYYGSYLPLQKSQSFIATLQSLSSVKSLQEFEAKLSTPLDLPSPIGQEELVRNTSNITLNLVQQNNSSGTIGEVVSYIEKYYAPIIDRGRGMSFEQNLYVLGTINEIAFIKTHNLKYLEDAHKYYDEGLTLGPTRPQFLYGMFDIYRTEGNVDGARAIKDRILSEWPGDQRTIDGFNQFIQYVASSTAASAKKK
jgi:hypothetical protein